MPFVVAWLYCLVSAIAVLVAYRPPDGAAAPAAPSARLTSANGPDADRRLIWATFNAAYVVYLSFAPRVLAEAASAL